ncbi:HAD-IB family phosphatase [Rickettsiella endosymbiont of Litargus connexus]|jgi:phosphoserine phosphatase|uniref:HAD-IB family phosphatase n=1 Tax=Rickettsiella endosymbiont of Litargus connexus TaxID=3066237 RepID=UPI0027F35C48|nr:HAD-IB family phosphatase [Gammaproteobacteria bacterium]MDD4893465.1 HAD-IB family phosphatase [Candidatus Rickettsiella isopodorum]MDD5161887.1 HAD-IB family phosphatase [Candidatus Rickettsiella isopodorum]MDQ5899786.1 hypothetical protein [Pseudomonadota bacterium]HKO76019.1 HAD-IB family phosphatase [Flavobacterium sp.]
MTGCIFLVDLDGTLTRRELLPLIAKKFNLEETIKELTYQCIRGEIPFVEGFLRRVEILKSIPISHIQEIIESVSLNESLVSFMQNNADRCYVVTGNLDVLVKPLCDKLKISSYTSIAIHKNDFIQGVKSVLNKKQVIEKLRKYFSNRRFVAIGEGHNDAEMMGLADVAIAYGCVHPPANSVMATASHVIFDEEILCNFLKQLS